jgi:hypothetical protein
MVFLCFVSGQEEFLFATSLLVRLKNKKWLRARYTFHGMSAPRPDFDRIKQKWAEAHQDQVFNWEQQLSEEAKIQLYAQLEVCDF